MHYNLQRTVAEKYDPNFRARSADTWKSFTAFRICRKIRFPWECKLRFYFSVCAKPAATSKLIDTEMLILCLVSVFSIVMNFCLYARLFLLSLCE